MEKIKLIEILDDRSVVTVLARARTQLTRPAPKHVQAKYGSVHIPQRDQISSIFSIWGHNGGPGRNENETFRQFKERDPRFHDLVVDYVLDTVVEYGVEL